MRYYDGTKKQKQKHPEEHNVQHKVTKLVRPTPPPLVENSDQDDMVSYHRNVSLIQQQAKKVAPSQHIITELMNKTFQIRRKVILSNPCRVCELIKTYPCLQSENQVCSMIEQ